MIAQERSVGKRNLTFRAFYAIIIINTKGSKAMPRLQLTIREKDTEKDVERAGAVAPWRFSRREVFGVYYYFYAWLSGPPLHAGEWNEHIT
ncbi:MAG: hypothetical protein ACUVV0_08100 [Anaerolineae bacterium]